MNSEIFQAYVEHVPMPMLSPDNIIVLDNLPAYKFSGARKAIERVGTQMMFLPPMRSGKFHSLPVHVEKPTNSSSFRIKKRTAIVVLGNYAVRSVIKDITRSRRTVEA